MTNDSEARKKLVYMLAYSASPTTILNGVLEMLETSDQQVHNRLAVGLRAYVDAFKMGNSL